MKTYLNTSGLAAVLPANESTVRKRITARNVVCDAVVVATGNHRRQKLFDIERLPNLRRALLGPEAEVIV